MKEFIKRLAIPEKSGKRIGLLRTFCAIFGGLAVAYLGMTLLIYIIPGSPGESIIVPLLFNTMVWAGVALWISVAPSRLHALFRSVVPSTVFLILILILYYL